VPENSIYGGLFYATTNSGTKQKFYQTNQIVALQPYARPPKMEHRPLAAFYTKKHTAAPKIVNTRKHC
jgi:hypothetical protein